MLYTAVAVRTLRDTGQAPDSIFGAGSARHSAARSSAKRGVEMKTQEQSGVEIPTATRNGHPQRVAPINALSIFVSALDLYGNQGLSGLSRSCGRVRRSMDAHRSVGPAGSGIDGVCTWTELGGIIRSVGVRSVWVCGRPPSRRFEFGRTRLVPAERSGR